MGLRLREIYKFYEVSELEAFLTAESFTDLLERQRYFELIARQDQKLYEEIEQSKIQIQNKKARLENILIELQDLKAEQSKEKEQALAEKEKRKQVLNDVRTKKEEAEKAIKDLEKAQAEVQSIIDKLERQRKKDLADIPKYKYSGNHYLDKNKGRIPWPTSGKLKSRFGAHEHPVFKTQTFNKGIDISAKKGTPVKTICDGTVAYVSWFRGYGKYLIIDHGEGYYTLYAHLSSIVVKTGAKVNRGEIIGYVGDTGSLIGDALHFELRKNGEPIDPMRYLKK